MSFRTIDEEWEQLNGQYKCPNCPKEFSRYGIVGHVWRIHTQEGKDFGLEQGKQNTQRAEEKRIRIRCLECNNVVFSKESKKFCNTSCAAKYNNRKRKESGWQHLEQTKKKIGESAGRLSPTKGKVLVDGEYVDDITIKIKCPYCTKTFETSKYRPRETCGSKKCLGRLLSRKNIERLQKSHTSTRGGFSPQKEMTDLRGRIIRYQGGYELRYIACLDALLDLDIVQDWKRSTQSIPYSLNGSKRFYLPDFDVLIDDVWEIHEVKGPLRQSDVFKFKSVFEKSLNFRVIFGKDLDQLEKVLGLKRVNHKRNPLIKGFQEQGIQSYFRTVGWRLDEFLKQIDNWNVVGK